MDGQYEGYLDLAAESGWGPCTECGEWEDRKNLIEYDGYLYHPVCIDAGTLPETPLPGGNHG